MTLARGQGPVNFGGICVLMYLFSSWCVLTVSKALDISSATCTVLFGGLLSLRPSMMSLFI